MNLFSEEHNLTTKINNQSVKHILNIKKKNEWPNKNENKNLDEEEFIFKKDLRDAYQSWNKKPSEKYIRNEIKKIPKFFNKGINKKISTINEKREKYFRLSSIKLDSSKIANFFQMKIKEGNKNYLRAKNEIDHKIKQGELNECLQRHESALSKLKLPKINSNLKLNKEKFKAQFIQKRKNKQRDFLIRNQSMPSRLEENLKDVQPVVLMQNIESMKVLVTQHESINRINRLKSKLKEVFPNEDVEQIRYLEDSDTRSTINQRKQQMMYENYYQITKIIDKLQKSLEDENKEDKNDENFTSKQHL